MKNTTVILGLAFILSVPTHSIEMISCAAINSSINNSINTYKIYSVNTKAIEVLAAAGIDYDYLKWSDGEATIERISNSRFKMRAKSYAVTDKFIEREFSLKESDEGCLFSDIYLPQYDENDKEYLVTLYQGGLLLNVGAPTERLLLPTID